MVSAVILYAGESTKLHDAITSIPSLSDIIVVCDTSRADPSGIPTRTGITVVTHPLDGDFSRARSIGMEKAKYDWVLHIDADEQATRELDTYIHTFDPVDSIAGYRIPRVDFFWGRRVTHGEVQDAASRGIVRLVHRKRGMFVGSVHERFVPQGHVSRVDASLTHYPHETITSFIHSVNFYSSIRARELSTRSKLRLYMEMTILPPMKFVYTYFIRGGFRDGPAGFVYSFMMSFHSFLARSKAITRTY